GGLSDLLLPTLLLRRRLLPLVRRGARRPGLGAVVLGRANRRARDARRVPRRERRRAHPALNRPEDDVSAAYTIDELMVTTLAHEFTNDTCAFNGAVSFVPVCAYLLARRTHAPELVWAASSIAIDADPASIPESTLSDGLWDGAAMLSNSACDFWSYAQGRRYNTFAFRGAQMDAYGNVNNTTIGPYASPKVRLPGGGGMADLGCMIPLIYLWSTTHDPRTFVERLDFRSGIGWGDGRDHRERLGLPGGP